MAQYIDKSTVVAEINRVVNSYDPTNEITSGRYALVRLRNFIDTLVVKEVDLEKLGEIARHLIAVKEHIEDMRLDKEEWFMLEKIGYPEKFKAQKG